ncbi:MAG: lactate racemase domain-containing protein, partial [Oscillibacter sp.]|nr:lactate racemase domain-containing protein [Oscillibacter sp.]
MNIELQQNIFQGGQPVEIELPDSWDVEYHALPGDSCSPLSKQQILEKLRRPYGSKPLFELAQNAREVCIVFDDITRGTPVRPMAEAVLEELHRAGIRKEQIRFLCATGTHAAQNLWDHTLKLGEEITRNYPVYNHNPYDNTVCIGRTKRGLDISVNAEFMRCDLRIGLGALTPHTMNAFGGGVKMLFPGLGGIDSIAPNHVLASDYLHARHLGKSAMMGNLAMDCMRTELEEVAAMAGQFFKVDCIYNTRLEPVDLYAGDPVAEYYAAVPAARKLYAVTPAR